MHSRQCSRTCLPSSYQSNDADVCFGILQPLPSRLPFGSTCIGRHPSGFMNPSKEAALSLLKTGLQLNHLANDKASGRQDATRLKASAGVLHPLFPLHGGVIQSVVPASEVEHTRVEHAMPCSTEEDHPSNRRINSPELSHRVARKLGSSLQATQV